METIQCQNCKKIIITTDKQFYKYSLTDFNEMKLCCNKPNIEYPDNIYTLKETTPKIIFTLERGLPE